MLDGAIKPISHKDFAEWPIGRPAREVCFAYARSPAKRTHNRDVRSTTQNPQELER